MYVPITGQLTPTLSWSARTAAARPSSDDAPVDRLVLSPYPLPCTPPTPASPPRIEPAPPEPPPRSHFRGAAVVAGLCMASAMLGVFAPAAHAADGPPPTSISDSTSREDMVKLARAYGLKTEVLEQSGNGEQFADLLKILTPNMRHMYQAMNAPQKKALLDGLHGSSGFLFVRVSNRDAFVRGEAAGHHIFAEMQRALDEQFQKKAIDGLFYARMSGAVTSFQTMSPQQRATFVSLLEVDVASQGLPH